MPASRSLVIWVGLALHHAKSARNLPEFTQTVIGALGEITAEQHVAIGNWWVRRFLKPVRGFGIVIDRVETPLTPHQVRTKTDLAKHYADEIRDVRTLFTKLGFTRAAQLYVSED